MRAPRQCGASIVINLVGITFLNFLSGLVLVGVGWNFLFTGGTALLTETYTPEEKAKVQGLNDFFIWGTISIGAVTSGAVQHSIGWDAVNLVMAPLVVIVLLTTLWLRFSANKSSAEGYHRVSRPIPICVAGELVSGVALNPFFWHVPRGFRDPRG